MKHLRSEVVTDHDGHESVRSIEGSLGITHDEDCLICDITALRKKLENEPCVVEEHGPMSLKLSEIRDISEAYLMGGGLANADSPNPIERILAVVQKGVQ